MHFGYANGSFAQLLDLLLVTGFLCFFECRLGRLSLIFSFGKFATFHGRRLSIEHIHGLDSSLQHAEGSREHALQMTRHFTSFICQLLLTASSDDHHELVDVHRSVDSNLAVQIALELLLAHAAGGVVR